MTDDREPEVKTCGTCKLLEICVRDAWANGMLMGPTTLACPEYEE